MNLRYLPVTCGLFLFISACHIEHSKENATNILNGSRVDYHYQTFTMTENPDTDSFQTYVNKNDLVAKDETERLLPKELQGLFFLDGAPFPDKTLSLKHLEPMDERAQRLRWTVPFKTTFAWLNTPKGHLAFAKAKSHKLQYELEWRDCTKEVLEDMAQQFALFKVADVPKNCTAADRKFAVINAYVYYDEERIAVPENILYFDMYLIPKNAERDYFIWQRRSKICNDNESSTIAQFCEVFRTATGRNTGDAYSRYQFTQVIDADGKRTSMYNKGLLPEVIQAAGKKDNIFLTCDPSAVNGDGSCIDGTERLPPIKDREIAIIADEQSDREPSVFERILKTRKIFGFVVKAALDVLELMSDGEGRE